MFDAGKGDEEQGSGAVDAARDNEQRGQERERRRDRDAILQRLRLDAAA